MTCGHLESRTMSPLHVLLSVQLQDDIHTSNRSIHNNLHSIFATAIYSFYSCCLVSLVFRHYSRFGWVPYKRISGDNWHRPAAHPVNQPTESTTKGNSVGWSLTALFSTNMAISETKGQGRRVILIQ